MPQHAERPSLSQLCYLEASKVKSPAGALSELKLLNADGEPLGDITGVIIHSAARRVLYFHVQTSGWLGRRRFLVRADQLFQVEQNRHALRLVDGSAADKVQDLDVAALRRFSDNDVLAAIFSPRAA